MRLELAYYSLGWNCIVIIAKDSCVEKGEEGLWPAVGQNTLQRYLDQAKPI